MAAGALAKAPAARISAKWTWPARQFRRSFARPSQERSWWEANTAAFDARVDDAYLRWKARRQAQLPVGDAFDFPACALIGVGCGCFGAGVHGYGAFFTAAGGLRGLWRYLRTAVQDKKHAEELAEKIGRLAPALYARRHAIVARLKGELEASWNPRTYIKPDPERAKPPLPIRPSLVFEETLAFMERHEHVQKVLGCTLRMGSQPLRADPPTQVLTKHVGARTHIVMWFNVGAEREATVQVQTFEARLDMIFVTPTGDPPFVLRPTGHDGWEHYMRDHGPLLGKGFNFLEWDTRAYD